MSNVLGLISNVFRVFGDLIKIIWSSLKWLFSKSWKAILIIGTIFIGIFGIKKATKEE